MTIPLIVIAIVSIVGFLFLARKRSSVATSFAVMLVIPAVISVGLLMIIGLNALCHNVFNPDASTFMVTIFCAGHVFVGIILGMIICWFIRILR